MNTKERPLSWTEIDTDDVGDDSNGLDLTKDLNEDGEELSEFKEESKDTRRGILTVSKGATKQKAPEEDDQDGTEIEKNKDEGEDGESETRVNGKPVATGVAQKEGRAHKRIKTLIGRLSEKDRYIQELESKVNQVATRSRQVEKSSVTMQKDQWKEIIAAKQQALEEAVDKANGKDVARLSQEIADATMKFNAFEAVASDFEDEPEEQPQQSRQRAPEVPEAARDWVERNPWFKSDPSKHVIARMVSQQLTQEGVLDPNDDNYWDELDTRMAKEVARLAGKAPEREEQREQTPQRRKGSPVGSRNDEDSPQGARLDKQFTRNGNRVQANPSDSDRDMAEKFGLNIRDYMKEKYKYAQQDYKGYVTIDIPGQ